MQLAAGPSTVKASATIKAALIGSDRGQHSAAVHIKCGTDWRSNGISGRRHKGKKKQQKKKKTLPSSRLASVLPQQQTRILSKN